MLQACLNGGRGFPAPASPQACAEEALAACRAGAVSLHIHPRDEQGVETLDPTHVAAWLNAVRQVVPGIPVGIGTGAWIAPGGRARHDVMVAWDVLPDYVSVNLGEEDAPEVMDLMDRIGVGIEAGVWCVADAARFLRLDRSVLRVLVEIQDVGPAEAETGAEQICAMLAGKAPILLHGEDRSAWAMIAMAARKGLDTRIGLEDVTELPDGTAAPDNAALVQTARAIIESGR